MHTRLPRLVVSLVLLITFAAAASAAPAEREVRYNDKNPLWDYTRVDVRPAPVEQSLALPPDLAKLKIRASLNVEYVVNKAGDVEFARVVKSTEPRFNDSILAGVRNWKFKPAQKDGEPVNCRVAQALTVE